jgi:ribosomal protein L40E
MDELTRYIIKNYGNLMTATEAAAYKNVIIEGKVEHTSSESVKAKLRQSWITGDAEVKELLKNGPDVFLEIVRERILKEHSDQVILNRCPKCNALARTPTAKQCPKCFYNWL